jgi:hypothetical protein
MSNKVFIAKVWSSIEHTSYSRAPVEHSVLENGHRVWNMEIRLNSRQTDLAQERDK